MLLISTDVLHWGASRMVRGALLGLLGSLGACASFQAHPDPVLATANVVGAANIDVRKTLDAYYSPSPGPRGGLSPEGYRNSVVGTYMLAADARYAEFLRRLSTEAKGSSFLLDLGILGLSGGASLAAKKTANALAAGAAGLTGTRAALGRDVYFDRALPALIGSMDAARTRIKTTIMVKMRQSADDYPLPVALADVAEYENAASLDSAIQTLTRDAASHADEARQNYAEEVLSYTGAPEPGTAAIRRQIRKLLRETTDVATLTNLASAVGLTPPAGADAAAIRTMIGEKVGSVDSVAGTRELATKLGVSLEDGK